MTTEKQVEANRRNAQLSAGPTTSAGKDVSRMNALKHGLRAETLVLPDEDPEDYRSFRQAIVDELTPIGELETLLADRIVLTAWRLRRAGRVEAGLFIRDHYQRVVEQANSLAAQYERNETDQLLASMNRSTITDAAAVTGVVGGPGGPAGSSGCLSGAIA